MLMKKITITSVNPLIYRKSHLPIPAIMAEFSSNFVGGRFAEQYYTLLNTNPEHMHR